MICIDDCGREATRWERDPDVIREVPIAAMREVSLAAKARSFDLA